MKLLITTQAVDKNDSHLGFFVRWLEEFAKHCEEITVICLREGEHFLPAHVKVYPLKSKNKIGRAFELLRYIVVFRHRYTHVLVHMNPEYLVAAVWLWHLLGKKIGLWYTHKSVDLKLRIAEKLVDIIFTASRESFRLPSKKVHIMGHGIDTDFFNPDPSIVRGEHWLSAGRLSKSKRHDLAIRAAAEAGKELRIGGEGPELKNLQELAQELGARVTFLGGLSHAQVRDEFRRAALFLHMSETGSLDKMILEAVACGCPVRTRDPALKFLETASPEYVREHHSLQKLIPAMLKELA